jgi:hypothetical protein
MKTVMLFSFNRCNAMGYDNSDYLELLKTIQKLFYETENDKINA